MRVRMLAWAAGPQGSYRPGQEVEVPDALGAAWLAGGFAERVDGRPEQPFGRRVRETATKSAREISVSVDAAVVYGWPVTRVPGIGKGRAAVLEGLGIRTVGELQAADLRAVADRLFSVSEPMLRAWLAEAIEGGED